MLRYILFFIYLIFTVTSVAQISITKSQVSGITDAGQGDLYVTSDSDEFYIVTENGTLRKIANPNEVSTLTDNGNGTFTYTNELNEVVTVSLSNTPNWSLTGNSGTNSATNFIGTSDAQDFIVKTNNTESFRILQSNQYVGLGITAPTSPLHIKKNVADGVGIIRAQGTEPDMIFNDTDGGFTTFTFENNAVPKFAFGRRDTDDFYITRNDGSWHNKTFNILNTNGFVGINTEAPEAQLHIKSNNVPFKIEPNTSTPTGSSAGQMHVDNTNGILYIYDATRGKWLSVDRTMVGWGRNNSNTTNEYLRQFNGAPSIVNGWRMIRNATITAISAQTDKNQTWTLEIRKNDSSNIITSLTISNSKGNHSNTVNINVNEGDYLQAYCNGNSIDYPQTLIEIAWRK